MIEMAVLAGLMSLASPLILWPIEYFLPYPYLIEEVFKFILVGMVVSQEIKTKERLAGWVVLIGIGVAISETMFYLMNFNLLGSLSSLGYRLLLTNSMHLSTVWLLYVSSRKGGTWKWVGLVGAIVIHYGFNWLA